VFVLDFQNTGDQIRAAFEPFYGQTEATPTDSNVLFDAADAVRGFGVIDDAELAGFQEQWASLSEVEESKRHAVLSTSTQGAYERALELDADERRELKDALARFVRFHGFLGQVVAYLPAAIEVLCQGSWEFPIFDHGSSPPCGWPVRAGRRALRASWWRRMR